LPCAARLACTTLALGGHALGALFEHAHRQRERSQSRTISGTADTDATLELELLAYRVRKFLCL
jgi:hypothetical protein